MIDMRRGLLWLRLRWRGPTELLAILIMPYVVLPHLPDPRLPDLGIDTPVRALWVLQGASLLAHVHRLRARPSIIRAHWRIFLFLLYGAWVFGHGGIDMVAGPGSLATRFDRNVIEWFRYVWSRAHPQSSAGLLATGAGIIWRLGLQGLKIAVLWALARIIHSRVVTPEERERLGYVLPERSAQGSGSSPADGPVADGTAADGATESRGPVASMPDHAPGGLAALVTAIAALADLWMENDFRYLPPTLNLILFALLPLPILIILAGQVAGFLLGFLTLLTCRTRVDTSWAIVLLGYWVWHFSGVGPDPFHTPSW